MNIKMQSALEQENYAHTSTAKQIPYTSFKMSLKNGTEVEMNPYLKLDKDVIPKLSSQSEFGISDEDVKCYKERYLDVAQLGSANEVRQHFVNYGEDQGRNPHCAHAPTKLQVSEYL